LLEEALNAKRMVRAIVFEESRILDEASRKLRERAAALCNEVYLATTEQMSRLSETKSSQGVAFLSDLVTLGWDAFEKRCVEEDFHRLIALDVVADPGNCGTILRSAAWFGLDGALFGAGCAEVESGKVARSSMGAVFSLPVAQRLELAEKLALLKRRGFAVVETNLGASQSLFEFEWPSRCVLLVGNEARGVSPNVSEIADTDLLIPRFGGGESLNAGVAASIAMAEWSRGGG